MGCIQCKTVGKLPGQFAGLFTRRRKRNQGEISHKQWPKAELTDVTQPETSPCQPSCTLTHIPDNLPDDIDAVAVETADLSEPVIVDVAEINDVDANKQHAARLLLKELRRLNKALSLLIEQGESDGTDNEDGDEQVDEIGDEMDDERDLETNEGEEVDEEAEEKPEGEDDEEEIKKDEEQIDSDDDIDAWVCNIIADVVDDIVVDRLVADDLRELNELRRQRFGSEEEMAPRVSLLRYHGNGTVVGDDVTPREEERDPENDQEWEALVRKYFPEGTEGPGQEQVLEEMVDIFLAKARQNGLASIYTPTENQVSSPLQAETNITYSRTSDIPPQQDVDAAVIEMLRPTINYKTLTLDDISTFDMGWSVKSIYGLFEIGRGSYGRVLMARHTLTDTPLAIKQPVISEGHASPGQTVEERTTTRTRATKEALVHQLLSDSPFFPHFWGTLDTDGDICLALEFIGDVRSGESFPLHSPPPLSARNAVAIAADVVRGVTEIHRRGLLHNDLKVDNVLLQRRGRGRRYHALIIDFGLVSTASVPHHMTGFPGSVKMAYLRGEDAEYLAPEIVLDEQKTSVASDIFSVGRIFTDIGQVVEDPTSPWIQNLSALGIECMASNPCARPSLDTILHQLNAIKRVAKRPPLLKRLLENLR